MRIVMFGDGVWARKSLLKLKEAGHELAGVVIRSQPSDGSLAEAAGDLGIPILQPENVNSPHSVTQVAELSPDLNLSIAYNQIIRRALLQTAPRGFINLHAGALPFYRGRNILNWAIVNGEEFVGITAHYIDEGIDTGDIILQRRLPLGWNETYGSILERVQAEIPDLVLEAAEQIASGRVMRTPQNPAAGTYFSGRDQRDEWLDWNDSSRNLHNKIRAITRPGPGGLTLLNGTRIRIWEAFYDPEWPSYIATPGQVVGRRREGAVVKTGDSVLVVTEAEMPSCEPTIPYWRIGERLGLNLMTELYELGQRVAQLEARLTERETSSVHC